MNVVPVNAALHACARVGDSHGATAGLHRLR